MMGTLAGVERLEARRSAQDCHLQKPWLGALRNPTASGLTRGDKRAPRAAPRTVGPPPFFKNSSPWTERRSSGLREAPAPGQLKMTRREARLAAVLLPLGNLPTAPLQEGPRCGAPRGISHDA